jgi:hypothetical protein
MRQSEGPVACGQARFRETSAFSRQLLKPPNRPRRENLLAGDFLIQLDGRERVLRGALFCICRAPMLRERTTSRLKRHRQPARPEGATVYAKHIFGPERQPPVLSGGLFVFSYIAVPRSAVTQNSFQEPPFQYPLPSCSRQACFSPSFHFQSFGWTVSPNAGW